MMIMLLFIVEVFLMTPRTFALPASPAARSPKLTRLCMLVALVCATPAHGGAVLYSYGTAAGDTRLPSCDDCSGYSSLKGAGAGGSSLATPFFGQRFSDLYVNNNGSLSFMKSVWNYVPRTFPDPQLQSDVPAIISAFGVDVDTTSNIGANGSVWSRLVTDSSQLSSISSEVVANSGGTTSFNATFAVIATWDHVGVFPGYGPYHFDKALGRYVPDKSDTFQLVLVSDGLNTYTMFKYPTGGLQAGYGSTTPNLYPAVGFQDNQGHYANAPGSLTAAVMNLPNQTNTANGNLGTLQYQLSSVLPSDVMAGAYTWAAAGGSGNWAGTFGKGGAAVFGGQPGTVTLTTDTVGRRLVVNSSGYTFTAASAANSLQVGNLQLASADTAVTFAGNLVLLTHEDEGGLAWNGQNYVQGGTLTQGKLTFTDNSVLVARGAGMVNGGELHLKKGAQIQIWSAGASTRNSTLVFDNTAGGTGGTLDLRGLSTTFGALGSVGSGAGLIKNSSPTLAGLTIDFDNSTSNYGGAIQNTLSLTKAGSGTLVLAGSNSYTGGTTLKGGRLGLGSANAIGSSGIISFQGGTLQFSAANANDYSNRFSKAAGQAYSLDTNGRNVTVGTALTSAGGSLAKYGAGTLALNGVNTYNGATNVYGGELKVNGTAAASAFFVAQGASLSGNGKIGALNLAGTLAPGDSPGKLTAGDTSFAAGSTYLWELSDASGAPGTGYDTLQVNGVLSLGGSATAPIIISMRSLLADNSAGDVANFDPLHDHSFTLVSTTGGISGYAATNFLLDSSGFSNALRGGRWSLAVSGNELDLNFAAAPVPEPGSYAMLLAGLALVGGVAHGRRKRAFSG